MKNKIRENRVIVIERSIREKKIKGSERFCFPRLSFINRTILADHNFYFLIGSTEY